MSEGEITPEGLDNGVGVKVLLFCYLKALTCIKILIDILYTGQTSVALNFHCGKVGRKSFLETKQKPPFFKGIKNRKGIEKQWCILNHTDSLDFSKSTLYE